MTVRRYEMLVMIDVQIADERIEEIVAKLKDMIEQAEGGEILTLDRWGKKRLAYEIKKRQFGYYVLYEFLAPSDVPKELDRFCRLDADVMRHLILVIPDKVLRLKEKEEQLKLSLEQRRQAAADAADKPVVEDLLEKEGDDSDEVEAEKAEDADDDAEGEGEETEAAEETETATDEKE